jgi:hypothetical protein
MPMNTFITIESAALSVSDCESLILVPLMALEEGGYIKTFTVKDSSHAKHEYHAMAQMAYFQYQDDELEFIDIDLPLRISHRGEEVVIDEGLILYRDTEGEFNTLFLGSPNRKKLLEAAYRYCTRWIRLDI